LFYEFAQISSTIGQKTETFNEIYANIT